MEHVMSAVLRVPSRIGERERPQIVLEGDVPAIECDDLCRMLGDRAELLGPSEENRPPESRSPTWLYHRAEWRPESARRR